MSMYSELCSSSNVGISYGGMGIVINLPLPYLVSFFGDPSTSHHRENGTNDTSNMLCWANHQVHGE